MAHVIKPGQLPIGERPTDSPKVLLEFFLAVFATERNLKARTGVSEVGIAVRFVLVRTS
jgi:hypothetical protein